uniref:Ig-like domain-containing protein n=1 Tax=Pundamilia nyererei TaxID=303518 RepID=A0A3B4GUJ5_9CICH
HLQTTYIRWLKDGSALPSSQRLGVTKSGSLKIQFLEPEDTGVYKCVAGPASDIFTLQLIGGDGRSAGRPPAPGPDWEEMLPSCYSHDSVASLQPRVEERLINVTLQADRGEIQQEQASELISSLLTHMSPAQLWTRTTRRGGQAKGKQRPSRPHCAGGVFLPTLFHTVAKRPAIIRQQQSVPPTFQKNIDISIGHSALLTNATRSLTIRCPAEGSPPPKISWSKDGALLQHSDRVSWDRAGLHILQLRASDRGQYRCAAANALGSDSEASQLLLAGVLFVAVHSSHVRLHLYAHLLQFQWRFCNFPRGVPRPTVLWHRKDGLLDAGAVSLPSGSLWIRNVSVHNQGTYSCAATNAIGKSTASTVLKVHGGPVPVWPVASTVFPSNCGRKLLPIYRILVRSHASPCFLFRSAEFGWRFGGWTTCSTSCGSRGTWLRRIRCVSLDGKDVHPDMCQRVPKPVTSPVPCNRQACPPRWSVSEWSKCSASCGAGQKQRRVTCQQLDAGGAARTLPAAACEGTSRPADTEPCSANNCPVWVTSPWGKCSGRCLGPTTTLQRRSVVCQHANGSSYTDCDLRSRPVSVRNCSSDLCDVQWRPGAWRACTVVCGSGFQSRRVDCVHSKTGRTLADQHCAWLQRPSTWQHCNTATCGSKSVYTWCQRLTTLCV